MAELTVEQKAERYDKAIIRAKSKIKNEKDHVLYEDDVLEIFPELAESKANRIIKVIRGWILTRPALFFDNGISKEEILAWLEKHQENVKDTDAANSDEATLIPDEDKQKFNIGDWVTDDGETYFHIISYANHTYQLETVDGTSSHFRQDFIESEYHLWSIEDAKAGDVLAAHECLVLFKELDGLNIKCYCTYHFMNNPSFYVDTLQNKSAFCPATRKQQELLFKAIREAGYEWTDKKELSRIEQKASSWSEDDEKQLKDIIELLPNLTNRHTWLKSLKGRIRTSQEWSKEDEEMLNQVAEDIVKLAGPRVCYHKDVDWLKSLKGRAFPKQEWSTEDDVMLRTVRKALFDSDDCSEGTMHKAIEWLKSLCHKNRWKPTKEQLNALESTLQYGQISKVASEHLNSLFNDIKKLK